MGRLAAAAVLAALGACTSDEGARPSASPAPAPTSVPTASPSPTAATRAPQFSADAALARVRDLAGRIGPREATTGGYRQAAARVRVRLQTLGYEVSEQPFRVPAGVSWGVPVPAGETLNVIGTPSGFDLEEEHLLIGAHLDTVPQAPGAEDNASGVAVLLELARMAATDPASLRLPVVFVAFGAEEPRGPGDDRHHYGSRYYVDQLTDPQRDALIGMLSLDRVGVGTTVPVCNGGRGEQQLVIELRAAARRADVPARDCGQNRSSDHWSFEKAGFWAARIGSTPYAEYHSARDRPEVVARAQLDRVGRLVWEWLTGPVG